MSHNVLGSAEEIEESRKELETQLRHPQLNGKAVYVSFILPQKAYIIFFDFDFFLYYFNVILSVFLFFLGIFSVTNKMLPKLESQKILKNYLKSKALKKEEKSCSEVCHISFFELSTLITIDFHTHSFLIPFSFFSQFLSFLSHSFLNSFLFQSLAPYFGNL